MMIVQHMGGSLENMLQALMHDATEAYLSDIAAPFKDELVNYRTLEGRVAARIFERFDIDPNFPKIIKNAGAGSRYSLRRLASRRAVAATGGSVGTSMVIRPTGVAGAKRSYPQDLLHPLEMKQMFLNVFDALIDERADENVRQLI